MKRIAVLTSAGDFPGMNAAIRAVIRRLVWQSSEVFGIRHGYAGLIGDDFTPLTPRDVGRISHGTMLEAHAVKSFARSADRQICCKS